MQQPVSLQLIAGLDQLATIRHFVRQQATLLGVSRSALDDLLLAVTEVVTNSIEHGYQGKPGSIEIEIAAEADAVRLLVRDQAPPFDPRLAPQPDMSLPAMQRQPGGLGWYLIRSCMDEVHYEAPAEGGNLVTLVKARALSAATKESAGLDLAR